MAGGKGRVKWVGLRKGWGVVGGGGAGNWMECAAVWEKDMGKVVLWTFICSFIVCLSLTYIG